MEENRIVLITGAKGGLGSFVTEAFLAAGDIVIGTSKSIQASDFSNPRFVAMASDLTDPASTSHLVDCVMERFRRIDVLVHVMGGFSGGKPIGETDDATWDRMMNLNLRAGFNILRAVIPPMRAAGAGLWQLPAAPRQSPRPTLRPTALPKPGWYRSSNRRLWRTKIEALR